MNTQPQVRRRDTTADKTVQRLLRQLDRTLQAADDLKRERDKLYRVATVDRTHQEDASDA